MFDERKRTGRECALALGKGAQLPEFPPLTTHHSLLTQCSWIYVHRDHGRGGHSCDSRGLGHPSHYGTNRRCQAYGGKSSNSKYRRRLTALQARQRRLSLDRTGVEILGRKTIGRGRSEKVEARWISSKTSRRSLAKSLQVSEPQSESYPGWNGCR